MSYDRRPVLMGLISLNVILMVTVLIQSPRAHAAKPGETVRASAIELVDGRGKVRAQLNVEDGGEVVFRLRDSKGEVRVMLGADDEGSGLLLLDGKTEPAIHMV